jgi:hypothetical protein
MFVTPCDVHAEDVSQVAHRRLEAFASRLARLRLDRHDPRLVVLVAPEPD